MPATLPQKIQDELLEMVREGFSGYGEDDSKFAIEIKPSHVSSGQLSAYGFVVTATVCGRWSFDPRPLLSVLEAVQDPPIEFHNRSPKPTADERMSYLRITGQYEHCLIMVDIMWRNKLS